MEKFNGIKIIKRHDVARASAVPDVVDHEGTTVRKKSGNELAGHVTDWVREWRERRRVERVEEDRNVLQFLGESSVPAKRGLRFKPVNRKSLENITARLISDSGNDRER